MLAVAEQPTRSGDDVSYNRDVRPLLSSRCFSCHGPDAEGRQAGLRLDQPDGDEGAHEFAIVPGSIDDSEVWNRITSDDPDVVMPPPDSHLKDAVQKRTTTRPPMDRSRREIRATLGVRGSEANFQGQRRTEGNFAF